MAVVFLVVGLGYGLLLNSKITTIQTTSFADRTKAKTDLQSAKNYVAALTTTLNKYKQSFPAGQRERLDQLLPEETDFPTILLTVKHMAETAKLELGAVTVSEVASAVTSDGTELEDPATSETPKSGIAAIPNLRTYDVNISVGNGTGYENFKEFVRVLESSEPLYDVQTLSFSAATGNDDQSSVYTLVIRTYTLPQVTKTET